MCSCSGMTADLPSGVQRALSLFSGTLHEVEPDLSPRGRVSCKPAKATRQPTHPLRVQSRCELDTIGGAKPQPDAPLAGARAGHGTEGLSMCHNAAQLTAWIGGGLVTLKEQSAQVRGGQAVPRGRIVEFSAKSRRNLMRLVSGKLKVEELPKFITLTYPDDFPVSIREQRRDLENWWARVVRLCPEASAVWKREWKQRQSGENAGKVAPHFHLLAWGIPDNVEVPTVRGVAMQRKFTFAQMGWWDEWRRVEKTVYVEGETGNTLSESWSWGGGVGEYKVYEFEKCPMKGKHKGKKVRIVEKYERVQRSEWTDAIRGNNRSWSVDSIEIPFKTWCSVSWAEVVGSDDPRHATAGTSVENVRSREGVAFYASKYICKMDEEDAVEQSGGSIGRTWGIFNREKLPWAEVVTLELGEDQRRRLLRIARRYVENKVRARGKSWKLRPGNRSFTWFCHSPEWWSSRLAPVV